MYSRAFIVVDALDECQAIDGCRSRFLSEIFNLQAKSRANIFATSRFIPEITERFAGSMLLEIRASEHDVRKYVDGHMSHLPPLSGAIQICKRKSRPKLSKPSMECTFPIDIRDVYALTIL
jgi:hypothetical protein